MTNAITSQQTYFDYYKDLGNPEKQELINEFHKVFRMPSLCKRGWGALDAVLVTDDCYNSWNRQRIKEQTMKEQAEQPIEPLEVQSLVNISTAHINPKDLQLLEEATNSHPWFMFVAKGDEEAGYIFYTTYCSEDPITLSKIQQELIVKGHTHVLINLWNWAISRKYDYVRLTSWGAEVPELPTFDWE
jgi:hypothetical protein